jgi:hypothetical protein
MLKKSYHLAVIALWLCSGALFFAGRWVRAHSVFQRDYGEGMVWWQSVHITDYSLVYKNLNVYPYMVVHYPPLYHLAAKWLASMAGDWMWSARLISLASALGMVTLTGALLYRCLPHGASVSVRAAAAVTGACFALPYLPMTFAFLARVDSLAMLLTFGGLALFAVSPRSLRGQLAAFGLFVAAMFTKQTAYIAPFVCLVCAFLVRPKRALVLACFAGVCGAVPFFYLLAATHGGFLLNTVIYNVNPFSVAQMIHDWSDNLWATLPLVSMASIEVALSWAELAGVRRGRYLRRIRTALLRSPRRRVTLILSLDFVLSAVQALSVGKWGASFNYFIEMNMACSALAGLFLFRWLGTEAPAAVRAVVGRFVVFALVLLLGFRAILANWAPFSRDVDDETAQTERVYVRAVQLVRESPGLVYSEDMSLLMRAGKELPAEPSIITNLATLGIWDQGPFLKMIQEQKFSGVVVDTLENKFNFTPRVRESILQAYDRAETLGRYTFYRPRGVRLTQSNAGTGTASAPMSKGF